MKVILKTVNYTYEGEILNNIPHGYGTINYNNGDKYIGECQFGVSDGFGIYYYKSGSYYEGFFSFGLFHGIGTYETSDIITKGTWRNNLRHGNFITTYKSEQLTKKQLWIKNIMIKETIYNYIQPIALSTIVNNPKKNKKYQNKFNGKEKICIGCSELPASSTNITCGHICMCYDCLIKCKTCPICRCNIKQIIQLYIS
jgi:hypothetical protein